VGAVILYSSIAAASAALGILPLISQRLFALRWVGWANALAAGLMLGAAYTLTVAGLDRAVLAGAAGAFLGIGFIHVAHALSDTEDIELIDSAQSSTEHASKVFRRNALHAAPEGIAIGAAMAVNFTFGIFMALAMAVHNIPEGTALCEALRRRHQLLVGAAESVAANIPQVLLAVLTFAVVPTAPGLLPWALGFAAGTLVYLVMVDPLPEAYRQAGQTSIALVTSVAIGVVVLLNGLVVP
jgi:zinc transporter ZupT